MKNLSRHQQDGRYNSSGYNDRWLMVTPLDVPDVIPRVPVRHYRALPRRYGPANARMQPGAMPPLWSGSVRLSPDTIALKCAGRRRRNATKGEASSAASGTVKAVTNGERHSRRRIAIGVPAAKRQLSAIPEVPKIPCA